MRSQFRDSPQRPRPPGNGLCPCRAFLRIPHAGVGAGQKAQFSLFARVAIADAQGCPGGFGRQNASNVVFSESGGQGGNRQKTGRGLQSIYSHLRYSLLMDC